MTKQMAKKTARVKRINSDENTLSLYLKEISHIPLLTREEEDEVARKAAQGSMAARNKLVSANLRFVVNVAKKFQGQGLPLPDLISEGNLGLMHAIERYDVDKGYHFISYAVWWIRQSIFKAVREKSRMIRLPSNKANEVIQVERARDKVRGNQSHESELREIAGILDMDASHVDEILNISRDMVSLDNPVSIENDSATIGDFVEDDKYIAPEEHAVTSALQGDIETLLGSLNHREAEVLRFRYGLMEGGPMSLKEIGDHFNLTKERIRQIENNAITRLRTPSRRRVLANYVA
ncbi:sigma-70 family RNA polymerase sigma factor [Leadbettera azotonutricia]|uniref:RNA polymerase sigma factor n=1 Tax=Leadbettera azotonutricia (strain ATCC BAA-888 / DSM 13862 / ZAS-9) TaxID=545695 RepID=F5Y7S6_LEAAZ|nr:RNA polymerase sigma factor RpoD/SigA [Leadbettera azotonutricia]AEF81731.1 RNA polymerase sigma factor RpoD [Leadbettera azotonutricia ZAS-9]